MGLERLAKSIINNAEQEAARIIADAEEKAAEIKKDQEKTIKELKLENEKKLNDEFRIMERRAMSSANLEVKKMILAAKKEMIMLVFENAKNELISDKFEHKKKSIMCSLLKKADREIEPDMILCSSRDAELVKSLAKDAIVGKKDIIGGIVAVSRNKRVLVDYSFDTMLSDIKSRHLARISEILFG